MKNIECQKGAKVICRARYDVQYNSVGVIIDVVRYNGDVIRYWVQDIKAPAGFKTAEWTYLESWDLVVENAQSTKRSSELAAPRKTLTLECPCGIFRARCDYHRD